MDASRLGGYRLIQKRRSSKPTESEVRKHYPGYRHRRTNARGSSDNAENVRQYVFERVEDPDEVGISKIMVGTDSDAGVEYFDDTSTNDETDSDNE